MCCNCLQLHCLPSGKFTLQWHTFYFFSRDSDLSTSFRDEEMLKKMRRCLNISTSFLNISTSYVIKTNISTSFLNISTSTFHTLSLSHFLTQSFFSHDSDLTTSVVRPLVVCLWPKPQKISLYLFLSQSTEINNHLRLAINMDTFQLYNFSSIYCDFWAK